MSTITQSNDYSSRLQTLAQPKFGISLITDDQGQVKEAYAPRILWEKIKGLFGGIDHTESSRVGYLALEFVAKGIKHEEAENTPRFELMKRFAERAGLLSKEQSQSAIENSSELAHRIAIHLLNDETIQDLNRVVERFYAANRGKLKPFFSEPPKVQEQPTLLQYEIEDEKKKYIVNIAHQSFEIELDEDEFDELNLSGDVNDEEYVCMEFPPENQAASEASAGEARESPQTVHEQSDVQKENTQDLENKAAKEQAPSSSLWSKASNFALASFSGVGLGYLLNRPADPFEDFYAGESFDKLKKGVEGACPIAEKFSHWRVMNTVNNKLTECASRARNVPYDSKTDDNYKDCYGAPDKVFRLGVDSNGVCKRRDWVSSTKGSGEFWNELSSKQSEFQLIRYFDHMPNKPLDALSLACKEENEALNCEGERELGVISGQTPPIYFATETKALLQEKLCIGGACIESTSATEETPLLYKYLDPKYSVTTDFDLHKYGALAAGGAVSLGCVYKACQTFQEFKKELQSETGTFKRKLLYGAMSALWVSSAAVTLTAAVAYQRDLPGQSIV